MPPQSYWLAGLALVWGLLYFGLRVCRVLEARFQAERRRAQQMSELHLATIEALARAIDAKDGTAENHIRRVRVYASAVARALGMTDAEVQAVRTAALLHDIGKLAVPDHILAKPGSLTPEEFQKVKAHPQVGADIIASVPFPYPVAPLIQSHHERWDGSGYPRGLRGEEIPLGARILFLVDYFDALTSKRPYHRPMTREAAVALVREESGKALDPGTVEAFLRILPGVRAEIEAIDGQGARSRLDRQEGRPAPGDRAGGAKPSVFDDIAIAHGELHALYGIAQTMGTSLGVVDTMRLITSRLASLVPFASCALFLYDDTSDTLACRFTTGVDVELMQRLRLGSGQGAAGWVVRNRRSLVNVSPAVDFVASGSAASTALQSALMCPLLLDDRLIGALAVYHMTPSFYHDDHRRLLERVCEQTAAVVHNAVVFERTHAASLTDPLTGLPNTRFMASYLASELARAERSGTQVSLLIIDLDDFKDINDRYGHQVGDRALREVAQALRGTIRPYDVCVRYAGDEFIVVLAGCGWDEAESKRLELQAAVEQLTFEPQPGEQMGIAISAGTAVFPVDGLSYESLLAKADGRMYRNKVHHKRESRQRAGDAAAPDDRAIW